MRPPDSERPAPLVVSGNGANHHLESQRPKITTTAIAATSRRERLPPRRDNRGITVKWHGHRVHICAGFAPDGRLLETFIRCGRPASDIDQLLDDIGVVISRALQFGDELTDLARGIGRLPNGESASLVGIVLDALVKLQDDQ
jgi:hypothetical protein